MSIQSQAIQMVSKNVVKRTGLDQQATIRHLRTVFNNTPRVSFLPREVRIKRINAPAFRGELVSVKEPEQCVLYFHGGAFVGGRTRTYHNFASRLAKQLNANVYLATYPFAPEHPFPAAANRCLEAYEYLLSLGIPSSKITLAGDSAGGGLALSVLLQAKHRALPMPRCTIGISPATNCLPNQQLIQEYCAKDSMLSADIVNEVINLYVPDETLRSNPFASPLNGEFKGLPPLMLTISNEEVLYGDALQLRHKAEAAGVKVRWLERSNVFHVWPILVPFLPEANRDLKRIVAFIQDCGQTD